MHQLHQDYSVLPLSSMNLMLFGYLKAPFVEAPLSAGGLQIEEDEALERLGNVMTVMNLQDL